MTALRRAEGLTYAALAAIAIAASCAKAENSPLADQGGDGEAGADGGGRGGTAGSGASGGSGGAAASGGTTSTGGASGKGGTTSTGGASGKGGTTSTGGSPETGGSSGSPSTTYGCLDGEGGQGGASGGAPGEAGAGGAGPGTLFFDDFEDGNADGWAPNSGSFSIVNDGSQTYEQSIVSSTSQFISAVVGTCWTDQIVEARVNVVTFNGNSTTNAAGLFARYVNAQTHYLIGMDSGNNGELFIGRRIASTSNAPDRIATKTNMDWTENEWHTLRLEVIGTSLKAYLDDVLELETTDAQITSGGVAVGVRHAHARFDDVKVTVP